MSANLSRTCGGGGWRAACPGAVVVGDLVCSAKFSVSPLAALLHQFVKVNRVMTAEHLA